MLYYLSEVYKLLSLNQTYVEFCVQFFKVGSVSLTLKFRYKTNSYNSKFLHIDY